MEGKEVFERGVIEELEAAKNNNDRYDNLQRIQKLLPYYDNVMGIAPELLRVTVDAMNKARSVDVQPIEAPFGNVDGHTYEQVMAAAIEIIENIRYVDIQGTFRALCELYATASDDEERKRQRADEWRLICGRRSRVVLTPRRWRQVLRDFR
jgi:hypothetical protein